MKKLFAILLVTLSLASCTKDENGNPCWTCTFQSAPPQDYCGVPGDHQFKDAQGNNLVVLKCTPK